jgi:hypothetical protein
VNLNLHFQTLLLRATGRLRVSFRYQDNATIAVRLKKKASVVSSATFQLVPVSVQAFISHMSGKWNIMIFIWLQVICFFVLTAWITIADTRVFPKVSGLSQ